MSSIYANTGVDLSLILYSGTGASETGIIDDTGQDLGYKYSSGSVGYDLGLVAKSGQDIGRILGGEVAAVYVSEACLSSNFYWSGNSVDTNSVISAAWDKVSHFSTQKDKWTRCTGSIGFALPRSSTRYVPYQYYIAVAFHVVVNSVDASASASLSGVTRGVGDNSQLHNAEESYSANYGLHITEVRRPSSGEMNFVVAGRSGYKGHCTWEWHADYQYWDYEKFTPVYDYLPVVVSAKVNEVTTRTLTVNLRI